MGVGLGLKGMIH